MPAFFFIFLVESLNYVSNPKRFPFVVLQKHDRNILHSFHQKVEFILPLESGPS